MVALRRHPARPTFRNHPNSTEVNRVMRAVRLEAAGKIGLREVAKPVAGPEDVLVRIEACGVCGTDRTSSMASFPARRR